MTLHASTRVLGLTRGGRTAEEAATGAAAPYRLHTDRQPAAPPTGYDYVVLAAPCPTGLQPRLRAAAAQEGGSEAENLLARCEPMDYQVRVRVSLTLTLTLTLTLALTLTLTLIVTATPSSTCTSRWPTAYSTPRTSSVAARGG